jgi:hypothetical protein
MADVAYQWKPFIYGSRGLIARYAIDRAPPQTYFDLLNAELVEENAISSRLGRFMLTYAVSGGTWTPNPLGTGPIHTLAKLISLSGVSYRYAFSGTQMFRTPGLGPADYGNLNHGLLTNAQLYQNLALPKAISGQPLQWIVFRPNMSAVPYIFFADRNWMFKDNGTLVQPQQMGIFAPVQPPTLVVLSSAFVLIDDFSSPASAYTVSNVGSPTTVQTVNTTLTASVSTGMQSAKVASVQGISAGMLLTVGTGATQEHVQVVSVDTANSSFSATFVNAHSAGETVVDNAFSGQIAANTSLAYVQRSFTTPLDQIGLSEVADSDRFSIFLQVSDPTQIKEIRVMFDVSDGSFTKDYYYKAIAPTADVQAAANNPALQSLIDYLTQLQDLGGGTLPLPLEGGPGPEIPPNILARLEARFANLVPVNLPSGLDVFQQVTFTVGSLATVGRAGQTGFTLHNVVAWRVQFTLVSNNTQVNFQIGDFYLYGGGGPDSTASNPYDYRYTWYNENTGTESNPSVELVSSNAVQPKRQPVLVQMPPPVDPQVTHARVYRRGGTLVSGWWFVGQVRVTPSGQSLTDTLDDLSIASNPLLNLDNDVPVTSPLNVPVDTTTQAPITGGGVFTVPLASTQNIFPNQVLLISRNHPDEETVIVQSVSGNQITAYFQNPHSTGTTVYAAARQGTPVSIMSLAFGRAWFAGDPNNPDLIYYSKPNNVEQVPPQNFIEVGSPNDPVMAIFEFQGQVYAMTLTTAYRLMGSNFPALVPAPLRTSVQHGLVAPLAYVAVEGLIWYLSQDGVYAFNGGSSRYMSEPVEWVFRSDNSIFTAGAGPFSPVPQLDFTRASSVRMAFYQNEVYILYQDKNGNTWRLIYHTIYNRWRYDNHSSSPSNYTTMLAEPDIDQLIVADSDNLIYRDRVGYLNEGKGTNNTLAFTMSVQTPVFDEGMPKNPKVYQDVTVDGVFPSSATVKAYFDDGTSPLILGNAYTPTRDQLVYSINAGTGQLSRNIGLGIQASLGTTPQPIRIYQAHYRFALEAQLRNSFDTYWLRYGSDEWKFIKQAWLEYTAQDTVTFSCYVDGNTKNPVLSFTLPASATRRAVRVRLKPVKARMFRWVATSLGAFQIYGDSHFEIKGITIDKGYSRQRILEEP